MYYIYYILYIYYIDKPHSHGAIMYNTYCTSCGKCQIKCCMVWNILTSKQNEDGFSMFFPWNAVNISKAIHEMNVEPMKFCNGSEENPTQCAGKGPSHQVHPGTPHHCTIACRGARPQWFGIGKRWGDHYQSLPSAPISRAILSHLEIYELWYSISEFQPRTRTKPGFKKYQEMKPHTSTVTAMLVSSDVSCSFSTYDWSKIHGNAHGFKMFQYPHCKSWLVWRFFAHTRTHTHIYIYTEYIYIYT